MDESSAKEEIKKHSWKKIWSGNYCMLWAGPCSITTNKNFKEKFGFMCSSVIYSHEAGVTTFYQRADELEMFEKVLLGLVKEKPGLVDELSKGLIRAGEKTNVVLEKYKDTDEFQKAFFDIVNWDHEYQPFQNSNKFLANVLPKELFEKHFNALEEARKKTENSYPLVEAFFLKMLKSIGKKEGCPIELLLGFTGDEILSYFKTGSLPSKEVLLDHQKGVTVFCKYENRTMLNLSMTELDKLISENTLKQSSSLIKGTVAFKGKATGKCRLVFDMKNPQAFNKGDILVTGMTEPDFLPIMEKAGAIVTDVGGLLCHAAIVARELKIPCIIGTEIATKVLKEGDIVEVDADAGIVKKQKEQEK